MNEPREEIKQLLSQVESLQDEIKQLTHQLEQKKSERRVDSHAFQLAEFIIKNSTAILFRRLAAKDPQKRKMSYVSPNISRFGYRAEDFLEGRLMFRDIVYPGDNDRTLKEIRDYVARGIEEYSQTYRVVTSEGEIRWVEDRTSVYTDPISGLRYHQGIVIDIHEKKEAEEQLAKSEEKYRRIVETAGEGFILMDQFFSVVDTNSAYACLLGKERHQIIGSQPLNLKQGEFERLLGTGAGEDIAGSRKVEYELTLEDGRKIPILIHGGSLVSDTGNVIGNMAFITDLTTQKKALQLAAEVQKGLLPDGAPQIEGVEIAGRSIPCDEVGGDYYDFLTVDGETERSLTVVVGDITGHGVESALLMTSARAFLRMRASHPGSLEDIVTAMNHHLTGDMEKSARFMTLVYLNLDLTNRKIRWIRAGHEPVLSYNPRDDSFTELKGPGMALGVYRDFVYEQQEAEFSGPGQILALFTDGITEGTDRDENMFGRERLKDLIRSCAAKSAGEILETILGEHIQFTAGEALEDDITLVIVKIL